MSERRRDAAWVAAAAASRGIALDPVRAEEVARDAAPILERFDALVADLRLDDDPYEFRRRLAAEAAG
jgi:hypothetical protein